MDGKECVKYNTLLGAQKYFIHISYQSRTENAPFDKY